MVNNFTFNNIFASYAQYEERRFPVLTKHRQGISNTRKGVFLEFKMPIPFLKLEPNEPLTMLFPLQIKFLFHV